MIKFDEFRGMHLVSWFPCIVTFRVPFPFDEILESSSPTMSSVADDSFHLILLFTID